jgi:glutathione S-transferase
MEKPTLYIGNKNYSSWSLRAWLMLERTEVPFDEVLIPLDHPETAATISRVSPSGKVPVLRHGSVVVWESLAIGEYLAETFPRSQLWPADPSTRARARAVSAEMHAGFLALRQACPMDMRARCGNVVLPRRARVDLERIVACWTECRERYARHGTFLFGPFTIADAMFAPIVSRIRSYTLTTTEPCEAYCQTIEAYPPYAAWRTAATHEPYVLPSSPPPSV